MPERRRRDIAGAVLVAVGLAVAAVDVGFNATLARQNRWQECTRTVTQTVAPASPAGSTTVTEEECHPPGLDSGYALGFLILGGALLAGGATLIGSSRIFVTKAGIKLLGQEISAEFGDQLERDLYKKLSDRVAKLELERTARSLAASVDQAEWVLEEMADRPPGQPTADPPSSEEPEGSGGTD